jgi:glutamate/tyrosine decarboxylase-like PLP-dependent enzyme
MNTPQTDRLHEAKQADDVFSAYYLMVNLSRQMEHKLAEVQEERDRLAEALRKLADCDWVITPRDRMDAVRTIAREALQSLTTKKQ